MLKILSDPHTVLKFQNLCGLTKRHSSNTSSTSLQHEGFSQQCHDVSKLPDGPKHRSIESKLKEEARKTSTNQKENASNHELEYNPYFHGLYFFGSSLGDEAFYTAFFPHVFWNMDEYLGRRLILLWVISMYFGQIMKDILRWPRPASPPVIVIERRYESEYGMPSTHATIATIIPFTLVYFTLGRYEYSFWLGVAFVVFWCCLVCLSRIYMGVHSFQDLIGGVLLGVAVLLFTVPYLDTRLELALKEKYFGLVNVVVWSFLIYLYPQHTTWTSSRRETTRVVGVGCGVFLGFWCLYCMEDCRVVDPFEGAPFSFNISSHSMLKCLGRWFLGVPILVLMRIAIKYFMASVLTFIMSTPGGHSIQNSLVDIPRVFVSYTVVGFMAVYLVPKIFPAVQLAS